MSKTTTTISFRCPPDILDQIDSIGREHFPKIDNSKTNSGCDRTKTLFAIIQAGIAALTDNEVPVLQSKTDKENSKTGITLDEVEGLVKKLISQNNPAIPDEWELSQLIRKEIGNSLEEGHIAGKIQDIRDGFVANFNEFSDNFIGRLAKVEGAVIGDKKADSTTTKKPDSTTTKKPDSTTKREPTKEDKDDIIKALSIQKILSGEEKYSKNSSKLFDLIEQYKGDIESKLGIKIGDMTNYPVREFNQILDALGYQPTKPKQVACPSGKPGKRLSQYSVIQK